LNDVLLEQLANDGNGNYAYVDDLDEAQKLFVEDLTSTLQVIALDAKIQVDFNPEVVAYYRLIGYENRDVADQDFRKDAVDAGEIGAGHSAAALYAVTFHPNANGRIATVQLRWEDPDSHQVTEINGNFNTWDLAENFEGADPRYQLAVVVAQYAELLRHSPWAAGTSAS
jgi:Ca-activated chloride channel family protein